MLKNISVLALLAVSTVLAPASASAAEYTPETTPKTTIDLVERFTNSYTPPVIASSTVKLEFEKIQVKSVAAPKPEPKPEPVPKAEEPSTKTNVVTAPVTPTTPTTQAAQAKQAVASPTTAVPAAPRAVAVSPGSAQAEAASQMQAYGWGAEQLTCLISLWQKESNWNSTAENPSSGAYGIPQSLPGTKMASAGADWRTNPATQIKWGLSYISERYKTPCGAWGHSVAVGWY
jgi:outer membrane biosynthesis protein TonB